MKKELEELTAPIDELAEKVAKREIDKVNNLSKLLENIANEWGCKREEIVIKDIRRK